MKTNSTAAVENEFHLGQYPTRLSTSYSPAGQHPHHLQIEFRKAQIYRGMLVATSGNWKKFFLLGATNIKRIDLGAHLHVMQTEGIYYSIRVYLIPSDANPELINGCHGHWRTYWTQAPCLIVSSWSWIMTDLVMTL